MALTTPRAPDDAPRLRQPLGTKLERLDPRSAEQCWRRPAPAGERVDHELGQVRRRRPGPGWHHPVRRPESAPNHDQGAASPPTPRGPRRRPARVGWWVLHLASILADRLGYLLGIHSTSVRDDPAGRGPARSLRLARPGDPARLAVPYHREVRPLGVWSSGTKRSDGRVDVTVAHRFVHRAACTSRRLHGGRTAAGCVTRGSHPPHT